MDAEELEAVVDSLSGAMTAAISMSQKIAPDVARTYRIYYEEFRKAGFDESQTMELLARLPVLQQNK